MSAIASVLDVVATTLIVVIVTPTVAVLHEEDSPIFWGCIVLIAAETWVLIRLWGLAP